MAMRIDSEARSARVDGLRRTHRAENRGAHRQYPGRSRGHASHLVRARAGRLIVARAAMMTMARGNAATIAGLARAELRRARPGTLHLGEQ
jgi:hypothetical protein